MTPEISSFFDDLLANRPHNPNRHPKCKVYVDPLSGEYGCGYDTKLDCEECKYGGLGNKNPEAKCNQAISYT